LAEPGFCARRPHWAGRLVARRRATLFSIGAQSLGRPAALPQGDFRAAVAFYPGSCNESRLSASWTSAFAVVLMGAEDVWTPMEPCKTFLDGAIARGARIEMQGYPAPIIPSTRPTCRGANCRLPHSRRCGPDRRHRRAARADALARVPAFLARFLGN